MELCLNKYEERTKKKKDSIIEAAMVLFQEKGFTDSGIKEIAEKAHVSQVSIYNYFGSKDALVVECAKIITKDSLVQATALLDLDIPYMDKLNTALSGCSNEINASLNQYLSNSALEDHNFMKLLSESIYDLQKELYIKFIELGKKEGYVDSSYPTSLIIKFISAFNTIELSPDDYVNEVSLLQQFFLHGILKNSD
ncbi:MAG TPA: TetR/AcrR family transcriptional regulator [Lachnospiraceae bacterium]|nr:TetR/AcrR family transcriptional regulator [Lachnospiraceae bacterium]